MCSSLYPFWSRGCTGEVLPSFLSCSSCHFSREANCWNESTRRGAHRIVRRVVTTRVRAAALPSFPLLARVGQDRLIAITWWEVVHAAWAWVGFSVWECCTMYTERERDV